MSESVFKGVVVPIVTPLTPQESVDVTSLRRLVSYLIDNGIHGIWAAGTTGEFAALSDDQRLLAIKTVADEARARVPVVANISAAGTRGAIEIASALEQSGVEGIAATPPYYYHYGQEELLAHYRSIHEASSIPLWVYNIPSTAKLTVEAATIAQLAGEGTVVGMKDSSGAGENLAQLVVLCRQRGIQMCRLLGSIYRVTMTRAIGAHGVVPGIANLAAASMSRAWEAGDSGDEQTADRYFSEVSSLAKVLRLAQAGAVHGSMISGLKSALKIMGIIDHDTVTQPLRTLSQEEKDQIPPLLQAAGLLNPVSG